MYQLKTKISIFSKTLKSRSLCFCKSRQILTINICALRYKKIVFRKERTLFNIQLAEVDSEEIDNHDTTSIIAFLQLHQYWSTKQNFFSCMDFENGVRVTLGC